MKKLKLNLKQASQIEVDAVLKEASSVIASGGLVIYPTETTYGIALIQTIAKLSINF